MTLTGEKRNQNYQVGDKGSTHLSGNNSSRGRPSDIARIFTPDLKYSGGPKEPLRRRYSMFIDACHLSGIDVYNNNLMMKIIQTTFVTGQAAIYFADVIKPNAVSAEEAINQLEMHFLDD